MSKKRRRTVEENEGQTIDTKYRARKSADNKTQDR